MDSFSDKGRAAVLDRQAEISRSEIYWYLILLYLICKTRFYLFAPPFLIFHLFFKIFLVPCFLICYFTGVCYRVSNIRNPSYKIQNIRDLWYIFQKIRVRTTFIIQIDGYHNYVIAKKKKNVDLKLRIVFLLIKLLWQCLILLYHGGIFKNVSVCRLIY